MIERAVIKIQDMYKQNHNSTSLLDYDFTFHRTITYNINYPRDKITINLNVKRNIEQRDLFYQNKLLKL